MSHRTGIGVHTHTHTHRGIFKDPHQVDGGMCQLAADALCFSTDFVKFLGVDKQQ